MFISGVDHARWIATKSDVDMEMVRACLRVLKHHGVIALVDMFFYSNRYECTERASAMLAGKEPKLLQEAMEYVSHLHQRSNSNTPPLGETFPGLAIQGLSASLGRHSDMPFLPINEDTMSFPPRKALGSGDLVGSLPSNREAPKWQVTRRQRKRMKKALAELYCSCNRNTSFSDLIIAKITETSGVSTTSRNTAQLSSNEDPSMELEDMKESLGKDKAVRLPPTNAECYGSRSRQLLSPSESSSFERTRITTQADEVDWKEVFEFFDHRRFATFGVVHGLLRRVHNFPRAIETTGHGEFPVEETKEISSSDANKQMERRRIPFRGRGFRDEPQEIPAVASREAAAMDGTKCDDELICEFEKPLDELFELVEASGRKVMSIYALGPERSYLQR